MTFERLGLSDALLKAVEDAGYKEPTPIQAQAIPQILMQRDILGIAQTGTGKTASFTLPMIDILAQGRARARMPRSLILEPTRELAAQVAENFEKYGANHKLSMALLIGGVNFGDQDRLIDRGVDVLIATPGRLLDHMERGKLMLTGIDILVIDEADRMLDMGFIPDVEKICEKIPRKHQTLFFSATMPPPIERLASKFLTDPKQIEVSRPSSTASTIDQRKLTVTPRNKRRALRTILSHEPVQNAIIFCNRKRDVKEIYQSLKRHDFDAEQLHGDMAQSERLEVLKAFKAGEAPIMVASDVAARGLDIAEVSHVINFDVPTHAEDYVHRIGRTGRAGRKGSAFTILAQNKDDARYLAEIEKLSDKPIPEVEGSLKDALASLLIGHKPAADESTEDAPRKTRRGRRGGRTADRAIDTANRESTADHDAADDSETENRRSASRTASNSRGRGGQSNRSDRAEQTERPQRDSRVGRASRDARDGRVGRGRRDYSDDGDGVVGMGDHVPAFLQNPVRISKS